MLCYLNEYRVPNITYVYVWYVSSLKRPCSSPKNKNVLIVEFHRQFPVGDTECTHHLRLFDGTRSRHCCYLLTNSEPILESKWLLRIMGRNRRVIITVRSTPSYNTNGKTNTWRMLLKYLPLGYLPLQGLLISNSFHLGVAPSETPFISTTELNSILLNVFWFWFGKLNV